ncbi:hypothetical protein SSX86_016213 [Deinandra increscens subsp. villosa]|uniref:Reverse transcriptase zinc-binding domain-containing protein n=1 Tax=Deinandra increscens subsp. villosa TaxID=3103831 RepID=A0AAP0GWY5_9ASTR
MVAKKKVGGLGIGSIRAAILGLLLKWIHRLKDEGDRLWALVVKAIHGGGRNWDTIPCNRLVSGPWKQVVSTLEDIRKLGIDLFKALRCRVGDGSLAEFWQDNWAGVGRLRDVFPELYKLEKWKNVKVNSRVRMVGECASFNWEWVSNSGAGGLGELIGDCEMLLGEVKLTDGRDRWGWGLKFVEEFEVGLVKEAVQERLFGSFEENFVWLNWLPIKINMFGWKVVQGRMPVCVELVKRGVGVDPTCPVCEVENESVGHRFLGCSQANHIWSGIWQWCRLPLLSGNSVGELLDAVWKYPMGEHRRKLTYGVVVTTLWVLWTARNQKVFDRRSLGVDEIMGNIKVLSFLWLKNRSKLGNLSWENWLYSCGC